MQTWGLDMSTSARGTAAVALEWAGEHAQVASVHTPLDAAAVVDLIAGESQWQWAVDVPFGWPSRYVEFLERRRHRPLTSSDLEVIEDRKAWRTSTLAQRATDVFLTRHPQIKARPLPAAFQMLGATAAMWALIEADLAERGVAVDRSSHQCALLTGARQALGLADKVIVQGQCRPHAYRQASQSSSFDDETRAVLVPMPLRR